jgi:DNA mismatch repair ATPase MutS
LVPGIAQSGLGIFCANRAGLPEEIVKRADEIGTMMTNGTPISRWNSKLTLQRDIQYKTIAEKFLREFDIERGNINELLQSITTEE